jgi:hypothetical protein
MAAADSGLVQVVALYNIKKEPGSTDGGLAAALQNIKKEPCAGADGREQAR